MSEFTQLNGLVCGTDGVFCAAAEEPKFDYSDGEDTEVRLFKILSNAQDLSSDSDELQAQINDWPSEYHLSKTRANLLRPLNLGGVRRVLELGCGCGSISRYLGELEGVQVDSVEGSAARAGLAALRCRDLDNVTISVANFNEVKIPANYYDLILFVGVTEYAGRFSNRDTDQQALQDLLALAKRATKEGGVTLVAIENRLGLKYMLGANEDHYALRFVGLDNYKESTGIRTYSKAEWEAEIASANYVASKFMYPFPDYKVPTVVVTDTAKPTSVVDALEGVHSRDYSAPFDLGESEHRAWQGLLEASNLADHANSFLILLSDSDQAITQMADFDLKVFESPTLNYVNGDLPNVVYPQRVEDRNIQTHLNAEISQLLSHTASLEKKIDLMSNSIGWRLMNMIRRLFRKTTI